MIAVALPVSAVAPKVQKTQVNFWTPLILQKGYQVASIKMQIANGLFDYKANFMPNLGIKKLKESNLATDLPKGILKSERFPLRRNATDVSFNDF